MSSSNECGTITNRTSIERARVSICPKVIETCRSTMRQRTTAPTLVHRRHPCAGRLFQRRVPLTIALLSLAFWPLSATEGLPPAPRDRAASRLESTVDTSIPPGDDFFAYANGAWLKAAVIPAGRDRWTVRDEINDRTRAQVAAILDDAPTAPPGSLARMVADFRSALLDQDGHRGEGDRPARADVRADRRRRRQARAHPPARQHHARRRGSAQRRRLHLGVGARTLRRAQHPRREDLQPPSCCRAVSRSGTATST